MPDDQEIIWNINKENMDRFQKNLTMFSKYLFSVSVATYVTLCFVKSKNNRGGRPLRMGCI